MFQCLTAALRCGEIVSFLAGTGAETPQQLCAALDRSASELRQGSADRAVVVLEGTGPTAQARVGSVIQQALHVPEPVLTEPRVYPSTRFSIPLPERFRFGVVLAASIALAAVLARVLHGPHSFWLPLTVAFIARPDLGPLIPRAMARTVGTLIGVGIAAAVSITGNSLLLLIVLSCLMAAAVPWASRRSHAAHRHCVYPDRLCLLERSRTRSVPFRAADRRHRPRGRHRPLHGRGALVNRSILAPFGPSRTESSCRERLRGLRSTDRRERAPSAPPPGLPCHHRRPGIRGAGPLRTPCLAQTGSWNAPGT